MPKKSVKENKNAYMVSRENANLTREAASEKIFISSDRIYRIENGATPAPDEVLQMAKGYHDMSLCNYYCAYECNIGKEYMPLVKLGNLPQITLEMLATLNKLNKEKERLIEITADGAITKDEMPDFLSIKEALDKMSYTIDSLTLWVNQKIAEGEISNLN